MKKNIFTKTIALIAVTSLMVTLLSACGATSTSQPSQATSASTTETQTTSAVSEYAAANGKVKMAIIASNNGGTFWGPIQEAFETKCQELGWEYSYMAPSGGEGGTADLLALCDTALVQGYNVIAAVMNDNDVFEDFMNRAAEQNVLVLGFNSKPGEDVVPAMVGIDSFASGYQQGEKIAEFATSYGWDEIRYFSACTALSNTAQQEAKAGILAALSELYDGEVIELAQTESQGSAATAQDQIGANYIKHPDVNTIFCIESYSAVGAGAFIEENNLQGKVIACGLALDADAFRRVQNGSWTATSSVDVKWMGEEIVNVAQNILLGKDYTYANYPDKIWVINQAEIDAYCEENNISMD